MNLYTPVTLPANLPQLNHRQQLWLLGSCFATQMGQRLANAKFRCDIHPHGVLYNPLSIATSLRDIIEGKTYTADDLFLHNGLWHSPFHHGCFSAPTPGESLTRINGRLIRARHELRELDVLLLTFGSSYIYKEKTNGHIMGNCHKLPESRFERRRLSVDEVADTYIALLNRLLALRPALQVVMTVSPIRHIRDGLHANQLGKAVLLLAIDALQERFPEHVSYFPAYELVLDELRDYRFYANDLVHPSELAVQCVWERLAEACFSPETRHIAEECRRIGEMLGHKPFRPDSEEYKRFLKQIALKIDQVNEKYPYLDFQNERKLCHTRLNASAE